MFDVKNSKFYSELMIGACKLLGLDQATATEADIDNALQKAGTLDEIKSNAATEALAEVKTQMADFETRISGLESSLAERDASIVSITAELTAKGVELETAKADLEGKMKEVVAAEAKIKTLAGEVSTLKASGIPENDADGGGQQYSTPQTVIQPVSTTALDKRLGLN